MKSHAKKCFKKKIKRVVKHTIKRKMEEFDASGCLDELIDILADATGMNSSKPWVIKRFTTLFTWLQTMKMIDQCGTVKT